MTDPLIGRDIEGRYKILEKIGGGGMGVVYRAHHALLNVDVALKVIRPNFAETPEARERFLREARTATALTHANIVAVRDVGEFEGKLYLTMDLVKGRTLQEVLEREGRMSASRAVGIIVQVLGALEAAHAKGIVHRDLKPGNIMVEQGDGIKVLDFGLAKWIGDAGHKDQLSSLTGSGTTVGTLLYMAPEQVAGDPVDGRSDLYSLSVMFYQLLSGAPPHTADSNQHLLRKILLEPPRPLSDAGVHVPALEGLILRGLAKEAKDRPANAAEYLRAMEGSGGLTATAMRATPTMERPAAAREVVVASKPSKRAPVAAIAAVLVLLGAGGFFGWRYWQSQKYERHVRDGRAAVDDKRWDDAIAAFEAASKIEDSAEAASGLKKARFESKKELAKKARTPDEEVKAWEEAAKYGDVEEELRGAKVMRGFRAAEEALDGGDTIGATLALSPIDNLVTGKDEKQEHAALSKRLEEMEAAEAAAGKVVDEAIATKDIFIERTAWEDYIKAFPMAARAATGKARLLLIETELKTGPGLFVDVTPRGAAVYVDGKKAGTSPVLLRDLPAGKHAILISAEAHDTLQRDIDLAAGGRIDMKEKLPPLTGSLTVTTNAPGADIYLDGPQTLHAKANEAGEARFDGVLIGKYGVKATAKGFDGANQEVEIVAKQATVTAFTMVEHPGTLVVKTNPPGLQVRIGSRPPQKSPVRIEGHPPGAIEIGVQDPGGFERIGSARVRGDAEVVVDLDLGALDALEKNPYDAIVDVVRQGHPEEIMAACDAFLGAVPGARATAEVQLVKRAMELLTHKVEVRPTYEVTLPEGLRSETDHKWWRYSPSGRQILMTSEKDEMRILNLADGVISGLLAGSEGHSAAAEWSPTEKYIAIPDNNASERHMNVFDTSSGRRTAVIDGLGTLAWRGDDSVLVERYNRKRVDGDSETGFRGISPETGSVLWEGDYFSECNLGPSSGRYLVGDDGLLDLTSGRAIPFGGEDNSSRDEGYHAGSRRAVFLYREGARGVTKIVCVNTDTATELSSIEVPYQLRRPHFSPNGEWIWADETLEDRKNFWVGVPLERSTDAIRIAYDPKRASIVRGRDQLGQVAPFALLMDRATEVDSAPYDRAQVFDLHSGKRLGEVPGPWKWATIESGSNEHGLVIGGENRVVVWDASSASVVFDRANVEASKTLPNWADRVIVAGDSCYEFGSPTPIWSGEEFDVRANLGLLLAPENWDHRTCFEPGHWRYSQSPSVLSVRIRSRLPSELAAQISWGAPRIHRHAGLWSEELGGGRVRCWRESDVLKAILPWPRMARYTPGRLTEAANDLLQPVLNSRFGEEWALDLRLLDPEAKKAYDLFLRALSEAAIGSMEDAWRILNEKLPPNFAAGLRVALLVDVKTRWAMGVLGDASLKALTDFIRKNSWEVGIDLVPNARPMASLVARSLDSENPETLAMAISKLTAMGAAEYLEPVMKFLERDEWKIQGSARDMVIFLGRPELHLPVVERLLTHSKPETRKAALSILTGWGLKGTAAQVLPILKDADATVRGHAAHTLAFVGEQVHASELVPLLKDSDKEVRKSALTSMWLLEGTGHEPEIERLLKDPEADVACYAGVVLAGLNYDKFAGRLVGAVNSSDISFGNGVREALRVGCNPTLESEFERSLKSEIPRVRLNAAEALVRVGRSDFGSEILSLLDDENKYIVGDAATVLGDLGDSKATERLRGLLGNDERWICRHAAGALGALGAREALQDLLGLLNDDNAWAVLGALEALELLAGPEHAERISPLLLHAEKDVRFKAAVVLEKIGDAEVIDKAVPMLRDPAVAWEACRLIARGGGQRHARRVADVLNSGWPYGAAEALIHFSCTGQDSRDWIDAVEDIEKNSPFREGRSQARIVLIALGKEDKSLQREMLDGALPWGKGTSLLLKALGALYEPETQAVLERVVVVKERIRTIDDLRRFVEAEGLSLDLPKEAIPIVPISPGRRDTLENLLRFWRHRIVPKAKTVCVMDPRKAIEYWRERLK